jgi:putative transposase
MRYSQGEKREIIRTVEESELSVSQTLRELDVPRSTFYGWYARYSRYGYEGLADAVPKPRKFWNRIPDHERERIVDMALQQPEKTPRELAWHITDNEGYYISESSVYRILKSFDLITSPAYIVLSAADTFKNPTKRVNELWQTDFTQFRVIGWGWYYLTSVLDDYSRYIISWQLSSTMASRDVTEVLDEAIARTGMHQIKVRHRARLLSDNGPCYISAELKKYLDRQKMDHTRGAPYHPMTQGKIERYHRSMKNVVKLENYYLPGDLKRSITAFVEYYNNRRYHESLNNVTPADVFFGKAKEVFSKREIIKQETLRKRYSFNLRMALQSNHMEAVSCP